MTEGLHYKINMCFVFQIPRIFLSASLELISEENTLTALLKIIFLYFILFFAVFIMYSVIFNA